jgi:hypothetical protein
MRKRTERSILACAILLALAVPPSVNAGDTGRYQIITQQDLILVLDTKEGHLWQWQSFVQSNMDIVYDTTYLGRMRPGKKPGELIDSWTWTVGDWRRRQGMSAPPE